MFSIFKKKKIVPHVRLTGIIGSAGKFKQGMELANQRDILKKSFFSKKNFSRCNINQFPWWITSSVTFNI